ncbi:hypothetical protein KDL45_08845, partial [bacterium]|nr:hypothetical protein [bacterium]
GTKAEPVATVQKGVDLAQAGDAPNVFIAQGDYNEDVMVDDAALYGAYDASDWSRDLDSNTTTILAATDSAVEISNDGRLTVDGLTLASESATSAVGIYGNATVTVRATRAKIALSVNTSEHLGVYVGQDANVSLYDVRIEMDATAGKNIAVYMPAGKLLTANMLTITGETSDDDAIAMYLNYTTAQIFNSRISLSSGLGKCIGIFNGDGSVQVDGLDLEISGGDDGVIGFYQLTGFLNMRDVSVELGDSKSEVIGIYQTDGIECTVINSDFTLGESTMSAGYGVYHAGVEFSTVTIINAAIDVAGAADSAAGLIVNQSRVFVANTSMNVGEADEVFGMNIGLGGTELGDSFILNSAVATAPAAVSDQLPLRIEQVTTRKSIHVVGSDLYGDSPDCLISADTDCVTDVSDVNACEWEFCAQAEGNLNVAPGFASDSGLHLAADSDLIDAGIDPSPFTPTELAPLMRVDIDYDLRPAGDGFDIGADEVTP